MKDILKSLTSGEMVIVVDDEDRENEGDIVIAGQFATPEKVNFLTKHARGLICVALAPEYCDRLELPMMVQDNNSKFKTAFTVSIEAKEKISSGISAFDRSTTIKLISEETTTKNQIVSPGHIFPLRARSGGVLVRAGHTEASVDLMKMAGLNHAAVICEILDEDGSMMRFNNLKVFAQTHNLKIISIKDIIAHRMQSEMIVEQVSSSDLPTNLSDDFKIYVFKNKIDNLEHVALVKGEISSDAPVLVRVHSECLTGDTFGSQRCDCGWQLNSALKQISTENGVLLYLKQEGRGIGLGNKIKAYSLQDQGMDTVEANHHLGFSADSREYGVGSQILKLLGIKKIALLTNNPRKIYGLEGYGLEIVETKPIISPENKSNLRYLETKRDKLGHRI